MFSNAIIFLSTRISHLEFRELITFKDELKHESIEKKKIAEILVIVIYIMRDRFNTIFSFIHTETSNKKVTKFRMNFFNFMNKDLKSMIRFHGRGI